MRYGVGLIGAGPGVVSLHLPTLERLRSEFRVVHISDGGSGRAAAPAERLGARVSKGESALLGDPDVEVVAVCSSPTEHARQVLNAVRAGVRGVLCEKPLALTESDAVDVVEACRAAGVALVVGTNHQFDPAWGRTRHHINSLGEPVLSVVVSAVLPPNSRYHGVVGEQRPVSASPSAPRPDWSQPAVAADVIRQLVTGLAVHDMPVLRDLAPHIDRIVYARPVSPIGYAIGAVAGDTLVQLTAVMVPEGADAQWRMTVTTAHDRIDVDFPPAFVHVGSARVRVRDASGRVTEFPPAGDDGYVSEWRALADMLAGDTPVEYDELLEDARYSIRLADMAAAFVTDRSER